MMIRNILLFNFILCFWMFNSAYTQTIFGVSGLIKSPDAYVVENGKCAITLGYIRDDVPETSAIDHSNIPQICTSFLVGPVSRLEIGLRISAFTEEDKIEFNPRNFTVDLVVTIKGVILKERKFVPQISLGIQDIVGTWKFQSTYLVLSKTIVLGKNSHIAGTVGYGSEVIGYLSESLSGKKVADYRFIGIFGNLEVQPFSFLSLLADYDAEDWNLGLKLNFKNIVYGKFIINEFKYPGGLIGVKFTL